MIEDALRDAFAARAGGTPPGSLDGIADAAIRNAGRVRRRRRAAVTGFAGIIAVVVAAVLTFQVITPPRPARTVAEDGVTRQPGPETQVASSAAPSLPQPAAREIDAIDGQTQPTRKVRLQLPDKGTVAAAYKAKDGYLVVNTEPDGDKQLLLQDDDNEQQVLVPEASNIAVAKDGGTVAWARQGTVTVAARDGDKRQLTKQATVQVPETTVPVAFVGSNLVLGREEGAGFDVWYTGHDYTESWDASVVRVFGAHPDGKSVYAEVKAVDQDEPMCLALLALDQPFKVKDRRCGLPPAARDGARISPDGHWLAYPVEGFKEVAMVDLTKVFTAGVVKTWNLVVTLKTVWLNATTFVVDSGGKFLAINPTVPDKAEPLNVESEGVVLIEPLYSG